jgi:hypothetical protein
MKLKWILLSLACFLITHKVSAQHSKKDLFHAINKLSQNFTIDKPTVVFHYTAWCAGSSAGLNAVMPILLHCRDQYHFIMIADDYSAQHPTEYIIALKPEVTVQLSNYGIKKVTYKQAKRLTQQFEQIYLQSIPLFELNALYVMDTHQKLLQFFLPSHQQKEMAQYFNAPDNLK